MAARPCSCCCPCNFAVDDWTGHLTTDFSFTNASSSSAAWSAAAGDGTTLDTRKAGAATIPIVANQIPSVELDVALTVGASPPQLTMIMGQIFTPFAYTPTGSTPGYQGTIDGSYRFLKLVNSAGTTISSGDASVPTAYFGSPAIFCALACQQGSNFFTTANVLDGTKFFGAGSQFEGITGTFYNFITAPPGAVTGTWGRAATKTVTGCEVSYSCSTLGKLNTPCSVDFTTRPDFTLGAATIYFGFAFMIAVGNLGAGGTAHYTVRFDRLCINII